MRRNDQLPVPGLVRPHTSTNRIHSRPLLPIGSDNQRSTIRAGIAHPVYLSNVASDPCSETQEQMIILVHNLSSPQFDLKEMATQDHLTGLKTRHFFDMYMSHEIEKVKRGVENIVILMIDVNNFKVINDTCGHVAGDQVLKDCATILAKSVRSSDVLFRFGGDEFLIVLSNAGQGESEILRQRITTNLNEWNSRTNEHDIRLSLSIGYALLTESSDLDEVIDTLTTHAQAEQMAGQDN